MANIIDVAKAAGVSTATVSRVLSQPGRVSTSTRDLVLEVITRLGYEPNVAARTLRTHRSKRILVLVPDISNAFYATIIQGIERAARSSGYSVVIGDTQDDPALEDEYANMLARREVDGLIFLGHRLPTPARSMIDRLGHDAPVINACEFDPDLNVPSVHIDNARAGSDAIQYLVLQGHEKIGVITGPISNPVSRDRLKGAKSAVERSDAHPILHVEKGDFSMASGYDLAPIIVRRGVTAIFCFSDDIAIGAASALRDMGLTCPGDISIIGFDDAVAAQYVHPSLTTISQPKSDIGRYAVAMLIDILTGTHRSTLHVTLRHDLVIRDSVVPPRK